MSIINDSGLMYRSAYFVLPRLAAEAMPDDWQQRFVDLLNEAYEGHGLETPQYYVTREGEEYVTVRHSDPEDDSSSIDELWLHSEDPWSNYRRADISDLCPGFSATPKEQ